jgi:acyl carrier protein phosphodiesterase
MNFLAHLVLAGDDEGLRLGAMLGDFVRGSRALKAYPEDVRTGIMLHRHIDGYIDALPDATALRRHYPGPFRRYAGIITDLAYDHELARNWTDWMQQPLADFDRGVREMLARHSDGLPPRLERFMAYADRRGLFASYADESEVLRALTGLGKRLSRRNPLHRVDEIWFELKPQVAESFRAVFPQMQAEVTHWLKSRSTTTGS